MIFMFSAMENDNSIHQRRFEAAVKVMRSLPADGAFVPSDDMLLRFYTYHQQATVGACYTSEPCGWDALSKAKWEAWKGLGDMSKEEAMKAYVEEILLILEMIPVTEEVSDLLDLLESFYEVVEDEDEDEDDETTNRPAVSMLSGSSDEWRGSSVEDVGDDVEEEDDAEDVTRLMVDNRAERGGSPVCNSSISSLIRSTHSSLNTDEEEEELEYTRETSQEMRRETRREMRRDSPDRFLQLLTEDGSDVIEPEHLSEVYGDSVRAEEGSGGLRAAAARAKKPEGRGGKREDEGVSQDGKPQGAALPPLCTAAHGPVQSVILSAGRGRGEGFTLISGCELAGESVAPFSNDVSLLNDGTVGECVVTDPVNTQIAVVLSRLQDDMRNVLARLNTLEAQAVSQVERFALCCEPHTALANKRQPTCPSVISQISVAFLLVWPFVAHFLVQLYLKKKRKMKL
ncbi:acyl-CoA-binding domain-containing protein 5-B isoform X2 [Pangasianodon hypophthalmus]|uniref:acyl-CoA-binding domain-containing protein 5-B isoform X2 n=1 Tax=Pangasianodon hypophthalmus TaxID=310915 RepID=UPI002306FC81|nr:acyl-CoA-binding domain-containing protein 5-B isoform X2 [Pangasianodon hypophthalmus]